MSADEGGDADPDRPHAWRDHEADERSEDIEHAREAHYEEPRTRYSSDPDDGPIDTPESFAAYVAYCEKSELRACLYPFGGAPKK